MKNTTLGYIEKDHCWLMLHRIKKEKDINKDKWIGIGGKMEDGETVLQCMQREALEETGLIWKDPVLKGIITFNYKPHKNAEMESELMFLFCGNDFEGTLKECDEGVLEWVPIEDVFSLPLWKGDLIFLDLLRQDLPLFYMRLDYVGDQLVFASLNDEILIQE